MRATFKLSLPRRISAEDSTLVAHAVGINGGDAFDLEVRCAAADPDTELAAICRIVNTFNAREATLAAINTAEALLDSVAFVARPGDTAEPLLLLRRAITQLRG